MLSLSTCIIFNNQAEQAVNFYSTIFKDLKVLGKSYCGENEPSGPAGSVRTVLFRMLGQDFIAVNGGPYFKFNEDITLTINCETQEEIDNLWTKLTADGGKEIQCGWLADKFGVFWQVTPKDLSSMMLDPDQKKSARAMQAILKMKKLNIAEIKKAFEG